MRFIIHNSLGPVAAEPDLESGAEEVRQKTVLHAFLLYILNHSVARANFGHRYGR